MKYINASWDYEVDYESGSSISTAYVTSIIALMIETNNDYSVDEILEYLRSFKVQNDFIDLYQLVKGFQ